MLLIEQEIDVRKEALRAALQIKPQVLGSAMSDPYRFQATTAASVIADAKQIEAYLLGPEKPNGTKPAKRKPKR